MEHPAGRSAACSGNIDSMRNSRTVRSATTVSDYMSSEGSGSGSDSSARSTPKRSDYSEDQVDNYRLQFHTNVLIATCELPKCNNRNKPRKGLYV